MSCAAYLKGKEAGKTLKETDWLPANPYSKHKQPDQHMYWEKGFKDATATYFKRKMATK
jgi:hypothetical protein